MLLNPLLCSAKTYFSLQHSYVKPRPLVLIPTFQDLYSQTFTPQCTLKHQFVGASTQRRSYLRCIWSNVEQRQRGERGTNVRGRKWRRACVLEGRWRAERGNRGKKFTWRRIKISVRFELSHQLQFLLGPFHHSRSFP